MSTDKLAELQSEITELRLKETYLEDELDDIHNKIDDVLDALELLGDYARGL